jgi:hypothetical protein
MCINIWEFLVELERWTRPSQSTRAPEPRPGSSHRPRATSARNFSPLPKPMTKFVTIDRWKTAEDFARFQTQFRIEYRTLDTQLKGLALDERKLGRMSPKCEL